MSEEDQTKKLLSILDRLEKQLEKMEEEKKQLERENASLRAQKDPVLNIVKQKEKEEALKRDIELVRSSVPIGEVLRVCIKKDLISRSPISD